MTLMYKANLKFYLLIISTLLTTLLHHTQAKNIDTTTPFTYTSITLGVLFGYSVELYKYTPTDSFGVLIGAPRATSSEYIEKSGVTYSCTYGAVNNCTFLALSNLASPNKMLRPSQETDSFPVEDKSNMWLGVSVASSPISGQILTCGHRYQNIGNLGQNRFVHGLCHFLPHINSQSIEISPCRECSVRIDRYFACQVGMSVAFDDSGFNQILGASSALNFMGTIFSGTENVGCNTNLGDLANSPGYPNLTRDAFLGYQVSFGRVFDRNIVDMVVSMPRYSSLYGGIAFFRNDSGDFFRLVDIIPGVQVGAYLGFSLITLDLNNDGLDEVIIGSPLYSKDGLPEIGNVQILSYMPSSHSFKTVNIFSPKPSIYSRFGSALAPLGDLDKDGFPEFAVGEPLGSSSGKVYIFSGDYYGSNYQLFQVIDGDDLTPSVRSFGSSISPGRDMDNNNYEDILIGAPLSDRVYLYHTRPVIRIQSRIVSSIQEINLNNSDYCLVNVSGKIENLICFDISIHISYTGTNVPATTLININISVDTLLVSTGVPSRAFFLSSGKKLTRLEVNEQLIHLNSDSYRFTAKVFVEDILTNLYTPLSIEATFDTPPLTGSTNYSKDVILLGDKKITSSLIIRNLKCGTNNICDSDLSISGYVLFPIDPLTNETFRTLIVNEVESFVLKFSMKNTKEEALAPILTIDLPNSIYFRREEGIGIRVEQRETFENGSKRIIIDLGSSMSDGIALDVDIHISVNNTFQGVERLDIKTTISSLNPEDPNLLADNVVTFRLDVSSRAILQLHGSLRQDQIFYNSTNSLNLLSDFSKVKSFAELGSEVIHSYTITNLKSSPVKGIILSIQWPLGIVETREFILYITELHVDDTNAGVTCDPTFENVLAINATNDHLLSILPSNRRRRDTENIRHRRVVSRLPNELTCRSNPEMCVEFKCYITDLPPSKNAQVSVRSRIFEPNLIKLAPPTTVWHIGSHASYSIAEKGVSSVYLMPKDLPVSLTSTITPNEIAVSIGDLEWYHIVIIIVVIVAIIIAIFIVLNLLYICGFFKIKKYKKHDLRAHGEYEEEFEIQDRPNCNEFPSPALEEVTMDGFDTI